MKKCETCWKFSCPYRNSCNGEMCIYNTDDSFDWQSFRAEAAKDILCHLLDRYTGDSDNKGFVEQAIGIADELIKQLKENDISV